MATVCSKWAAREPSALTGGDLGTYQKRIDEAQSAVDRALRALGG